MGSYMKMYQFQDPAEDMGGSSMADFYLASDVDAWIKRMMLDTEESNLQALHDRIAELEQQLAQANDAAAKGDLARANAGGMEMRIQELEKALRSVRTELESNAGLRNEYQDWADTFAMIDIALMVSE